MAEYQTFVRRFSDIAPGRRVIFIKDLTPGPRKYDTRLVQVDLSDRPAAHPDWDTLWLRSEAGRKHPDAWALKVVREMGEVLDGGPYEDVFVLTERLTENPDGLGKC
jgi:hypothetical protein